MDNSLITIIIPCYNYAEYVAGAIESVFAQTYKNIELIVINDGSTDHSEEVILHLQKKYNFLYLTQSNEGIVPTRNKGIAAANGAYIIQLDADDELPPNYVETLVSAALKSSADIFYTPAKDLETNKIIVDPPEFDIEILKHSNFIHTTAMVRAEAIKKYSYDDYLNSRGLEDWDIFLAMCLDGSVGQFVKKTHLKYRQHTDGNSRGQKSRDSSKSLEAIAYILYKNLQKHPTQMAILKWYVDNLQRALVLHQQQYQNLTDLQAKNLELIQQVDSLQAQINAIKQSPAYRLYKKAKTLVAKKRGRK